MTRLTHTGIAAAGHALVAVLLIAGKAGYGGRPRGLLGELADHPAWALIHVLAAAVLLAAAHPRHRAAAACASASVMGVWSLLLWWWAASLDPDATWLAAALGLVAATHSLHLADSHAQDEGDQACG